MIIDNLNFKNLKITLDKSGDVFMGTKRRNLTCVRLHKSLEPVTPGRSCS